jgi:hypothetical protein
VAAKQLMAWISDEPMGRMADRIGVIAGQGTLDELHRRTGKIASSLEDTFLTLVAEPGATK